MKLSVPLLDLARVHLTRAELAEEVRRRNLGVGWLQGWTHEGQPNPRWLSLPLVVDGQVAPGVASQMPGTIDLLRGLGSRVKVCALNKLLPQTLIPSHSHREIRVEGLLQYHLCLTTSRPPCFTYLNVNGEFIQHVGGQARVFDGSLPHFAVNATSEERVIVYMEFHADALRARGERER